MKRFLLISLTLMLCMGVKAQNAILKSLETSALGQGTVTLHQDASIAALIGTSSQPKAQTGGSSTATAKDNEVKRPGYRVLVYAGNNTRQSKNEATSIAQKIGEDFPDLTVYTMFTPPRWMCKVGDYTSIEEADAMMRQLRKTGSYKEVTIVKDQVVVNY